MRLILYKNYLLHFNGEFHIHYMLTCNNFQRDIIEYYQKSISFKFLFYVFGKFIIIILGFKAEPIHLLIA